jgi:predicted metal-binding membrane protein
MGEMPMPGGWTMSMMWMRMPGQTWLGATASFTAMWILTMAAMMLPSFVPMLWRYRHAVGRLRAARAAALTALVCAGYLFVWALIGAVVFPIGASVMAATMRQVALAQTVPVVVGIVVLTAGALQVTAWKARHLACCRHAPGDGRVPAATAGAAWRHGLRLGMHCSCSSAGLTAVMLTMGMMDIRVMATVTAAITIERLAPAGQRIARAIGVVTAAAGLLLIARTALP